MTKRAGLLVLASLLLPSCLPALDGKWMPEQILELDPQHLRSLGLAIDPAALWSREGGGLLDATVQTPGCSGGFISAAGLFATNHHCAYGALQQGSTRESNLIAKGFFAGRREQEIAAGGVRATVPLKTTDVTAEVVGASPPGADDLALYRAREKKGKELVAECERQPARRCQLAVFDGGVRYLLVEGIEYPDVRLVFAPPSAVGEYGGDIDNWSWPRHTGDFALLRVYTAPDGKPAPFAPANVPLQPKHFFKVGTGGVAPGDFVMVAGYPGNTYRNMTLPEMRERALLYFPRRAELYRATLDILEKAAAGDEAARLALADRIKVRANQEKNSRGQIDGIARGRMVEAKEREDREILAWAAGQPEHRAAVAAYRELERLAEARRATWDRDFLLQQAGGTVKPLEMALSVVRSVRERAKPDLERDPAFMERNRTRFEDGLKRDQSRFHLPTEIALLTEILGRFAALPAGSRSPAADALLAGAAGRDAVAAKAAELLTHTRVTDPAERQKMLTESEAELAARHDPLLDFALRLDREEKEREERQFRFDGAVARLRPPFRRAAAARAGRPLAADGNGTLRVSLAHVQGYRPRDGMLYEPQTTVAGMVAKATGAPPFVAPEPLLQAAATAGQSRFADPRLHDVPVAFLADGDTTSGSSGSPVLDARGQLVGLNFDRVWENVANDFGWNPAVARSIAVDVRYLLWVMETLHGAAAAPLFSEMGIGPR